VILVPEVIQEEMEQQDLLEPMEKRVQLVLEVIQEEMVLLEHRALLV
jgi:hypothetical protein